MVKKKNCSSEWKCTSNLISFLHNSRSGKIQKNTITKLYWLKKLNWNNLLQKNDLEYYKVVQLTPAFLLKFQIFNLEIPKLVSPVSWFFSVIVILIGFRDWRSQLHIFLSFTVCNHQNYTQKLHQITCNNFLFLTQSYL